MGIVYLAKDPLIGRLVALKTIRPSAHAEDEDTREFQARFVREAQAAGILNHPSIVTVHDIGVDEPSGMSFIAMEYVEGSNLKEVLAQGRPLSFEQAGDIVAQVAEGLDFAHTKGIVHRDVKPANIILLDGNRAKITDFGIAKITSGVANLTTTGQFLGTPNYMAPEQIKGTPVDGRSDIFSLGICLYECLTHRKPFGGDSLTSISYKIVHEAFPPLHEINPTIPEGFADVVTQCLEKDPTKRYQRGKDLANALRAVIRGERPVRSSDPLFADATVVTRHDHDKLPTMEIPFPEAERPGGTKESPQPLDTNPSPGVARQPVPSAAAKPVKPPKPAKPAGPPIWKQRIHPIVFFAIAGILLAILGVTMLVLRAKRVSVPLVDTRAVAKAEQEKRLRDEGNKLLHEGRLNDANLRYQQLLKMAPQSPAILALTQKLSQVLQKNEAGREQLALAQQKFDAGVALFNEKKFSEAIPLLEQSFHLNPSSDATADYLKRAQQEDERVKSDRAAARSARTTTQPRQTQTGAPIIPVPTRQANTTRTVQPAPQTASGPASISVVFNSPSADGYLVVKIGSDEVVRENLWYERRLIHTHAARQLNVTKEFPAKNADLDFWVVIPSLNVSEHGSIRAQKVDPGVNHKLILTFDSSSSSKKVNFQFN